MKKYTDYDFYIDTYQGDMPRHIFDKLVIEASCEVRNAISDRDYQGYEEEVQHATCSVIDVLYEINKLKNKKEAIISDKMLKSESVGDYSRTFESTSINDIDAEISNQNQKIKEEIRKYLLPTGLLYRGV